MKNLKLAPMTLGEIRSFDPCPEGWKTLCTGLGTSDLDTEVTMSDILKHNGVKDAFWALRTQDIRLERLIAAEVAESVLYIFEEKFLEDKRPRECIEVTRKWCNGEATDEELESAQRAASSAADDAHDAYYYAYDASSAASSARAAAAAADAHYAASFAATYAARKKQWKKNEDILRRYM